MGSIASDDDGDLYSLPIKDRGLRIPVLQECASVHCESSKAKTGPLVAT